MEREEIRGGTMMRGSVCYLSLRLIVEFNGEGNQHVRQQSRQGKPAIHAGHDTNFAGGGAYKLIARIRGGKLRSSRSTVARNRATRLFPASVYLQHPRSLFHARY